MNVAELAAIIGAIFLAPLACAGTFALLRGARLMREATLLIRALRERGVVLLDKAQEATDGANAAVARAHLQLDKAESVTASMDELGAGMAELAEQVTALAGAGRAIAAGPVGRAGALAFAVRRAVGIRRAGRRALPGTVVERQ